MKAIRNGNRGSSAGQFPGSHEEGATTIGDFQTDSGSDNVDYSPLPPNKRTVWQKIGAGSLSISLVFHLVLLVIGLVWVLRVIPPPEKNVDFMAKSGGGGSSSAAETQIRKHQVRMAQPNMSRVSAMGATSNLTLPEPDQMTQMTSLGSLETGGSLSKGLGGAGAGGGKGSGNGLGFGSGMAPGMSDGSGNKNPFGMLSTDRGALKGTFYDLKQGPDRKPTEFADKENQSRDETDRVDNNCREEIRNIIRSGLRESAFRKFFKAPQDLYQTKLLIPEMDANAAPEAFNVAKDVAPRRWLVHYRGTVQAPKTGKFRFVGLGDDILYVRFNGRPVFDYGYTIGSIGTSFIRRVQEIDGTKDDNEALKDLRRNSPMKPPLTFYKYASTAGHNNIIGGLAVGPEFSAEAGKNYPVDILIGEIPGGKFSVYLLIEEIGAAYSKDPNGFPILPLFRLDQVPPAQIDGLAPPVSADGPVWKFVSTEGRKDI